MMIDATTTAIVMEVAPKIMKPKDEIDYDWRGRAKAWVAAEVAAKRLPDIPRSDEQVFALFTPQNVLAHMELANPEPRGLSTERFFLTM